MAKEHISSSLRTQNKAVENKLRPRLQPDTQASGNEVAAQLAWATTTSQARSDHLSRRGEANVTQPLQAGLHIPRGGCFGDG
jgi:hypothetical protein